MKLILTASIKKTEFNALQQTFPISILKIAAKKSIGGLGTEIKSSIKTPETRQR